MSSPPALPGIAFAMRYPDDIGLVWASMARFLLGAITELSAVARSIICFPRLTDRPAFPTPCAIRVACDWYDTRSATSRQQIQETVKEYRVEVVVYVSCLAQSVDLRFLRGLGLRTINIDVDSYPAASSQWWLKWAAKRFLRGWLGIGIHDCYVANAHHQRHYLLEFCGLSVRSVATVVNGVDVERYQPGPPPDPATLGLPATDYYVVSVSQARPEKRVDVLIDAAVELFRSRPELAATFVHIGGGPCLEEWQSRAAKHGLAHRYQFLGSKDDVVPYLSLATVFVHAAERESFGFAVVEAMSCGKPVIATQSPGPAEIIEAGKTGILVEPGDSRGLARELLLLLDDPSRRERMGNAGRERVERHYNNRRQAAELAEVIRGQLRDAR